MIAYKGVYVAILYSPLYFYHLCSLLISLCVKEIEIYIFVL